MVLNGFISYSMLITVLTMLFGSQAAHRFADTSQNVAQFILKKTALKINAVSMF